MNVQDNIPQELFTPASDNTAKQEHIARQHHSAFYDGWVRLRKNKAAVICAVIILIIAIKIGKSTRLNSSHPTTSRMPSSA